MQILVSIIDFGFNITGIRLINQVQDHDEKTNFIYKIIFSKICLLIPVFILLFILTLIIPNWRENTTIILFSFTIVLGNATFNSWYLLGNQKTATLSALNFLSRLIYLVGVLIFVKGPEEAYLVNVFNGSGWFVIGLINTFIILKSHRFLNPKYSASLYELYHFTKTNSSIFISNFLSQTYRSIGIIIAGFIFSSYQLGIYGILDKVITLITNFFLVIASSIYPRVSFLAAKSVKLTVSFYKKLLPRIGILATIGSLGILFVGPFLLEILTPEIIDSNINTYLLTIAVFPLLMLANLPISLSLLSFNYKKEYFRYNLSSLLIFCAIGFLLGKSMGIVGLLTAILLTEFSIFIVGLYYLTVKKIQLV